MSEVNQFSKDFFVIQASMIAKVEALFAEKMAELKQIERVTKDASILFASIKEQVKEYIHGLIMQEKNTFTQLREQLTTEWRTTFPQSVHFGFKDNEGRHHCLTCAKAIEEDEWKYD